MAVPFRVIDTGVREGRLQIAFDAALVELHKQGSVPDTVRFLRFEPSALVGRHQAVAHELKLDFCKRHHIGIVRRMTGGGAIYLDPGQVGWEIVLSRQRLPMPTLGDYTRAICEAVAQGLSTTFGIDARFRPRNDIEVGGQKLCGTGGFFDGDTLIYQGTVLVDADPARVMGCLNVPEAKLRKRDLDSAEQRVTTLKSLLGTPPDVHMVHKAVLAGLADKLDLAFAVEEPSEQEWNLASRFNTEEIGTDDFVYAIDDPGGADVFSSSCTGPGGTVSAYLRVEGPAQLRRIREVLFTGDFFVTPPRLVYDLEAALRGVDLEQATAALKSFFAGNKPDLLTISPMDFARVLDDVINLARS
jgi:lipoate---protein ligase